MPRTAATAAPTTGNNAGLFGRPRNGTGAKNGLSVSTNSRSRGQTAARGPDIIGRLERHDSAKRQHRPQLQPSSRFSGTRR